MGAIRKRARRTRLACGPDGRKINSLMRFSILRDSLRNVAAWLSATRLENGIADLADPMPKDRVAKVKATPIRPAPTLRGP